LGIKAKRHVCAFIYMKYPTVQHLNNTMKKPMGHQRVALAISWTFNFMINTGYAIFRPIWLFVVNKDAFTVSSCQWSKWEMWCLYQLFITNTKIYTYCTLSIYIIILLYNNNSSLIYIFVCTSCFTVVHFYHAKCVEII
jgi:hypothetical protein